MHSTITKILPDDANDLSHSIIELTFRWPFIKVEWRFADGA